MKKKLKDIPDQWIEEHIKLLQEKLPSNVQDKPFLPDDSFYLQYYRDPLNGLHTMATLVFQWLKISPNGCVIYFQDESVFKSKSSDAVGFYTTMNDNGIEKEIIIINSKYKNNPLAVGAILAHEMMHLYLFRLGLKLENTRENELLTDLATIQTGLSLLILNGMSYSYNWWITAIALLFGVAYVQSRQLSFGYFNPKQYGKYAGNYFDSRNISKKDLVGYLSPLSRQFLLPFQRIWIPFVNGNNATDYVKKLVAHYRKTNAIKLIVFVAIVSLLLGWHYYNTTQTSKLESQIADCKATVLQLESQIKDESQKLNDMDAQMTAYQENNDVNNYNSLIEPYNDLLAQGKKDYAEYNQTYDQCNTLIDKYNSLTGN